MLFVSDLDYGGRDLRPSGAGDHEDPVAGVLVLQQQWRSRRRDPPTRILQEQAHVHQRRVLVVLGSFQDPELVQLVVEDAANGLRHHPGPESAKK